MSLFNKIGLEKSGTMLVSFPLICQILLVLLLLFPLLNLQTNIAKLSGSGELISKTISLINHTMNLGYIAKLNGNEPSDEALQREVRSSDQVRLQLAEVREAAKGDESRLQLIQGLSLGADTLIRELAATREEYRQGIKRWRKINSTYDKSIRGAIAYMLNNADSMVNREESLKQLVEEKTESDWRMLNFLLLGGLILSTLAAFGLGALYVRGILMPLKHLNANCQLVAEQKQLPPVINDKEEFTKLDELLHVITDATKEEQIREQAMVDNTNDLICSLNQKFVFLRANKSAVNFLGHTPSELVGKPVFEYIAPEERTIASENFEKALSSEESNSFEIKMIVSTADIPRQIHTRWSCVYSAQSKELFAVVHDIDEEKIIETMKQDFVDMVSHDLRSPLSSMNVALDLVANGIYGDITPAAEKELAGARRNLNRLLEFVNDLLDFQKLKHGSLELECNKANIEELVQSAIDLVKPALDAKSLSVEIAGDDITAYIDAKKINQVLTNLISNAIRYTPKSGTITISWNLLETGLESSDGGIEISVSDTGPGIPEAYQKSIFEAFEQTPDSASKNEGTGLGLAICKLICDAHNGSISLQSKIGEGSKFTIKIPSQKLRQD